MSTRSWLKVFDETVASGALVLGPAVGIDVDSLLGGQLPVLVMKEFSPGDNYLVRVDTVDPESTTPATALFAVTGQTDGQDYSMSFSVPPTPSVRIRAQNNAATARRIRVFVAANQRPGTANVVIPT